MAFVYIGISAISLHHNRLGYSVVSSIGSTVNSGILYTVNSDTLYTVNSGTLYTVNPDNASTLIRITFLLLLLRFLLQRIQSVHFSNQAFGANSTIFSAAGSKSSKAYNCKPELSINSLAFSMLVPCNLTTTGISNLKFLVAAIKPSAT